MTSTKPKPLGLVGYVAVFLVLMAIGILAKNVEYGRILILIYGIAAIVFRISSEDTFKMAIISLLCLPILQIMRSAILLENFAEYAFLLMVIGVICTAKELFVKKQIRNSRSNYQHRVVRSAK